MLFPYYARTRSGYLSLGLPTLSQEGENLYLPRRMDGVSILLFLEEDLRMGLKPLSQSFGKVATLAPRLYLFSKKVDVSIPENGGNDLLALHSILPTIS
jgi:hypothetical protein